MIKGLKETIIRRNGNKEEYTWEVKHIEGSKYEVPELGFTFDAETGETNKKQGIGQGYAKIGEPFKNAGRTITYELIIEEEPKAEEKAQAEAQQETAPTTLVKEWRYEDGRVEVNKEYTGGQLWEKGGHKRLYFDSYGRGAYVDLKTNTFHPDRRKEYKLGEWIKNWGAKVEYRFVLR